MTRECGEYVVRLVNICGGSVFRGNTDPRKTAYLPKITQSPCDVPMKNSIGNDNHAFVREAINA